VVRAVRDESALQHGESSLGHTWLAGDLIDNLYQFAREYNFDLSGLDF
jgi:hypothetical protein